MSGHNDKSHLLSIYYVQNKIDTITILQMGKLRLKEVATDNKKQSLDPNQG